MASAARQRVAWIVLLLLVVAAIWLFATGRRTTEDLVRLFDWMVPLLLGYWLGARTERRRLRDQQKERRGRLAARTASQEE